MEELKLVRWADDGFPPLHHGTEDVIELILEVKKLRFHIRSCTEIIDLLKNRIEGLKL